MLVFSEDVNVIHCNAALDACGKGRSWCEAAKLLDFMKQSMLILALMTDALLSIFTLSPLKQFRAQETRFAELHLPHLFLFQGLCCFARLHCYQSASVLQRPCTGKQDSLWSEAQQLHSACRRTGTRTLVTARCCCALLSNTQGEIRRFTTLSWPPRPGHGPSSKSRPWCSRGLGPGLGSRSSRTRCLMMLVIACAIGAYIAGLAR